MSNYKNSQWRVTKSGLETVRPEALYQVDKSQLDDLVDRGGGPMYDLPVHLAEKDWVDLSLFRSAYISAFEAHGIYLNTELLEASFQAAKRLRSNSI